MARDVYVVLDHTRALLVALRDGALPGNVGGGSNLRNAARRVFAICARRGWDAVLSNEGIAAIASAHRKDLEALHGEGTFPEDPTYVDVMELEQQRWRTTDEAAKKKLEQLLKKNKGKLDIAGWVVAVTTYGLAADKIAEIAGCPIPDNLYAHIAEAQERNAAKTAAPQLYDLQGHAATEQLYYTRDGYEECFELTEELELQDVLDDAEGKQPRRVMVFDRTIFYPTSGGQANDEGAIEMCGKTFKIVNVTKVGPCVLHFCDAEVDVAPGRHRATMRLDAPRRRQLMCHHTGAHVLAAACRRVLGPHVWQAGARKTTEYATLDVTHYRSVTFEETRRIEEECQRIVMGCHAISKQSFTKDEAERRHGFQLYQGGVVPGGTVRVVEIAGGVDAEACCGTHLPSTGRVGPLRVQRAARVSDGVVRF